MPTGVTFAGSTIYRSSYWKRYISNIRTMLLTLTAAAAAAAVATAIAVTVMVVTLVTMANLWSYSDTILPNSPKRTRNGQMRKQDEDDEAEEEIEGTCYKWTIILDHQFHLIEEELGGGDFSRHHPWAA